MSERSEVLVVGAGPTGLALACLCRQQGLAVRIVDKQPGPSTTSKAIGLQFRVSEVLAAMGIVDRFLERGSSPTPVNAYDGDRHLFRLRIDLAGRESGRDAFTPLPIMIPQSETEAILGDRLGELGAAIEWSTELLAFEQDADGVVSHIRTADGTESEIVSNWLVSCEGAHSVVRRQLGIAFRGKTYPLAFLLADVEMDWAYSHDENHVWMHEAGTFAALPLPSPNRWRFMFEVSGDRDADAESLTPELIGRLLAERRRAGEIRIDRFLWLSEFRINCRMVDAYRRGRVFLAGDAAHIHSPVGGQGITTCVQDATNLAWKLGRVARGAPEALLDTYEEERAPHAAEVLRETDRMTTVFFSRSLPVRLLRDLVVLPIMRSPTVQRLMIGRLTQLHVSYRGSSLARQEIDGWTSRPRVAAGDRCPDVAFRVAGSDRRTTLFELLEPFRPVVLLGPAATDESRARCRRLVESLRALDLEPYVVDDADAPKAGDGHLVDLHGDFRRLYGYRPEFLCLVRPDGHVGLLQRPIRTEGLADYLDLLCYSGAVETVRSTA